MNMFTYILKRYTCMHPIVKWILVHTCNDNSNHLTIVLKCLACMYSLHALAINGRLVSCYVVGTCTIEMLHK